MRNKTCNQLYNSEFPTKNRITMAARNQSNTSLANNHLSECPGSVYYLLKAPEGGIFINYVVVIPVNILLSILGTTANVLVLLAYFKKLRRRSNTEFNTTLLAFLAAVDLLTTGVVQPFAISRYIIELCGTHSCLFWLVIRRLIEFTVPVSFLTVGIITYERYQALFHPTKYRSHSLKRRIKRAMLAVWLLALVTTVLRIFKFFANIYFIISFLIMVILVVGNAVIYYKIGRMAAEFSKARAARIAGVATTDSGPSRKTLSRDKRATKTLFYIFLSLVLCYLPVAAGILYWLITDDQSIGFLFGYYLWADTFAFLNSTLDPFIYCLRNPRLKKAVLELLCLDKAAENMYDSQSTEGKNSLMLQENVSTNRVIGKYA